MKQIQFIGVDPEEERSKTLKGFEVLLNDFKKNFEPKTPEEYLSRQETSILLKADLSSIHNWTKRGILQSYGIAGRVYYKRSEIEKAIVKLNK